MLLQYLLKPCRFDAIDSFLKQKNVKILDVGCGNHSPSITKKYYPDSIYYGLDRSKNYNLSAEDLKSMAEFFEVDLSKKENLDVVPNDFFDCIIFNHVIEHLINGDAVAVELLKKLKKNGVLYLETPTARSVGFPKMKGPFLGGCLNYYDDPTHVNKPWDEQSLIELFKKQHCRVVFVGIRRSFKRIVFFLFILLDHFLNLVTWMVVFFGIFLVLLSRFLLRKINEVLGLPKGSC